MSDEQRNTVWRFAIIFACILCGFLAVMGKIIYVQTVERDAWLKVAEKQVPTHRPIQATRGNILDCNGQLLASSMPQYYAYMDASVPALHENNGQLFTTYIDTLARDLSLIVPEHTQAEYKARITRAYLRSDKRLRVCDHRINYLQRRELERNPLIKKGKYKSGIFFEDQYRRIKPFGMLASRTIGGIYGDGGGGNSGLEKRFDKELRGIDGKNVAALTPKEAKETAQRLRDAGIPMAIVTSSDRKKMMSLYRQHPDFPALFDHIITGDMVVKAKPDPYCYQLGAQMIGVDIKDCIVVEDSRNGLLAGRASGARVVGIATTLDTAAVSELSDLTVATIADLTVGMLLGDE